MINNKLAGKFLTGLVPDNNGLYVTDYLKFSEQEMEDRHDWIQWAFPITTPSPHNEHAPLIDAAFRVDAWMAVGGYYEWVITLDNIRSLVVKYCKSIGINFDNPKTLHDVCIDMSKYSKVVKSAESHHIKRISRMLQFLHLLHDNDFATSVSRKILRPLIVAVIKYDSTLLSSYTVAYWNAIINGYDQEFNNVSK